MSEFLMGLLRFGAPMVAVVVAALLYLRCGVLNVALDGQLQVAAITYVLIAPLDPWMAIVAAYAATAGVGGAVIALKGRWNVSDLLAGLGLLYFSFGAAQLLSAWVRGNAGYAQLGRHGLGETTVLVMLVGAVALVGLVAGVVAPFRTAKVIGDAPSLAQLAGVQIQRWRHIHSLVGTMLLTLAAASLVEHGGSFTGQLSAQRGFLALAVVAVVPSSVFMAALGGVLLAAGQLFVLRISGASVAVGGMTLGGEVFEAGVYLAALTLVVRGSRRRSGADREAR